MNAPLNVLKNNLVRAVLVAREWNCDPKCGHLEENAGYFRKQGEEFLKVHESTCAVYEAVLLVERGGVGDVFTLLCPRCRQTVEITDSSCW
jgi:hypothetical protein